MRDAALADLCKRVELVVTRGEREWSISPAQFEEFAFEGGEGIQVLPAHVAERLKGVWAHDLGHDIEVAPGHSIRVPKVYDFAEFKGFRIPTHLIKLTGGGPETLEPVGRALIENYQKYTPFSPDMTIIDLGCGIGRLAFQLLDWFKEGGAYIGIDVTSDLSSGVKKILLCAISTCNSVTLTRIMMSTIHLVRPRPWHFDCQLKTNLWIEFSCLQFSHTFLKLK